MYCTLFTKYFWEFSFSMLKSVFNENCGPFCPKFWIFRRFAPTSLSHSDSSWVWSYQYSVLSNKQWFSAGIDLGGGGGENGKVTIFRRRGAENFEKLPFLAKNFDFWYFWRIFREKWPKSIKFWKIEKWPNPRLEPELGEIIGGGGKTKNVSSKIGVLMDLLYLFVVFYSYIVMKRHRRCRF